MGCHSYQYGPHAKPTWPDCCGCPKKHGHGLDEINKGNFPGIAEGSRGAAPRTVVFKPVPAALISRKKAPIQAPAGRGLFLWRTAQVPPGLAS